MGRLWFVFVVHIVEVNWCFSLSLSIHLGALIFSNYFFSQIYSNILLESVSLSAFVAVICKNSVFKHLNLDEVRLSFLSIYLLGWCIGWLCFVHFGLRTSISPYKICVHIFVSLSFFFSFIMISISLSFHSIYLTM